MAAQAGLCLAWSETPEDTFCRVVAQTERELQDLSIIQALSKKLSVNEKMALCYFRYLSVKRFHNEPVNTHW